MFDAALRVGLAKPCFLVCGLHTGQRPASPLRLASSSNGGPGAAIALKDRRAAVCACARAVSTPLRALWLRATAPAVRRLGIPAAVPRLSIRLPADNLLLDLVAGVREVSMRQEVAWIELLLDSLALAYERAAAENEHDAKDHHHQVVSRQPYLLPLKIAPVAQCFAEPPLPRSV